MSALRPPRANVPAQHTRSGRMHSPPRGVVTRQDDDDAFCQITLDICLAIIQNIKITNASEDTM